MDPETPMVDQGDEERKRKKRERDKSWYEKNKERSIAISMRWRAKNKERANENERRYRASNREKRRFARQRYVYGHMEGFAYVVEILKSGKAVCQNCFTPGSEGKNKTLCIDHDHTTNRIRGILCHFCNCSIGYSEDRPERLESLAAYLRNPPALRDIAEK